MKNKFLLLILMSIILLQIVNSVETSEFDIGTSNSIKIKDLTIEEKILAYNQYIVDCLLQNVKTNFKILIEAKANENVFFSKELKLDCNYLWCDSKQETDLYFKVTYQFTDEFANSLTSIYIFLKGNQNLQIDLKLDACKYLDSNVEESKFLSDLNYYEKKIFLMLNHLKFFIGDKITIPLCKESSLYTIENLEKVINKINNDFGKKYNLPIIQYNLVDDLSSNNLCYKTIYEFLDEQDKKSLEKITSLVDNRESFFVLNKVYYSKELSLSQLNNFLNNNNRFLYVYEDEKQLTNLFKEIFSKIKFIRPSVVLDDELSNKIRYFFIQKTDKIIIIPVIFQSYNNKNFAKNIILSYEFLQKIQSRDYRITDVFNKKEYFQLELKTDATSFINSRFLNNEDLLRKYLSDYYTPIEISKLKDVKIYVYVKSLDTVHDVFSWGFTRSYAPKSPIEVLKNLKKIENEIKAGTFRFIKVNYTYRKSEKQIVQKITMSLLEACKNNFFVKLSVYNSLKNNCNIDLCKMDYSSFDIFKYIYDVSGCYNIDPLLIISLIARESDGINNFKETGAVGLGQFTTKTGEGNDLLIFNNSETYHDFRHHPLLNIGASISYLKERLDVAMKDLSKRGIEDALWYYNFGQKPIINYFSNIKSSKISEKINLILENAPANDTMNKKLEISQYAPTILSYYLFYNFLGISKKDSSSFSKDINSLLSTYNSALYFPQGEIK